jgi:hypothetical protein
MEIKPVGLALRHWKHRDGGEIELTSRLIHLLAILCWLV